MKKSIVLSLFLLSTTFACTIESDLKKNSPVPTNGLIAWYPFNGNANDESGNGNNAIINGAILTKDRAGKNGSAYAFDGKASQISVNNLQELKTWSISLWFNTNNEVLFNGPQYLLTLGSKNHSGNGEPGFGVHSNLNTFCPLNKVNDFFIFDGKSGCSDVLSGTNYLRNSWYNIVLIRENDVYSIYSSGFFVTSGKLLDISIDRLVFGKRLNFHYAGLIDDIGLWNRALTSEEIRKIYNEEKF